MRRNKQRAWMLPMSMVLLIGAVLCALLLFIAARFRMPAKAAEEHPVPTAPLLDRDDFIPEPTEPPTEPPAAMPSYTMHTDLETVASHHATAPDVVGWIYIPDTVIDYPVVQTNNNSFYTDHSWTGQSSYSGALFADWRCRLDTSDNSLIYGHNMGNGTMLHAIKNYKDETWGKAHPYFEIDTLEHRYLYRVISVNVINGELGAAFEYWNYIEMNRTAFRDFAEKIKESALVWYGDDLLLRDGTDQVIALQTCNSGSHDGMRCVVFAVRAADMTDTDLYDPNVQPTEGPMEVQGDRGFID